MKKLTFLLLFAMSFATLAPLAAQVSSTCLRPRDDDHFQRNRVLMRIDLEEKINLPLIKAVQSDIYTKTGFSYNNGIVAALIGGLEEGKYLAYHPEDLTQSLTFDDVEKLAAELNPDETDPDEEIDWEVDEEWIDEGDIDPEDEEVVFEPESDTVIDEDLDLSPYEAVLEVVEDRIFDKNRSDMIHDIKYIRLVWVDPAETLPDKIFAVFKYEDVVNVLDDTRWANNFNDAETRTLKEIFELRLFNSYVINVSGKGVKSLAEAEYRRNQLVAFEHNLWSY